MTKKTVRIDGQRLRALITKVFPGKRQKEVAADLDVSEFVVSRWLAEGTRSIRRDNVEKLASYCGMSHDQTIAQVKRH